jgi:SAM-dependent methyltransferase
MPDGRVMARSLLKRGSDLHRVATRIMPPVERILGGGTRRERVLLRLLGAHYASSYRREWVWSSEPPHFYPQRWTIFDVAFRGQGGHGPYALSRGFFNAEILQRGDHMLDIGCGDGFYVSRFYARCESIDALDVDEAALATARQFGRNARVTYHLQDAVSEPFPKPPYDVIAWDGAIGHFAPETIDLMLNKIAGALAPAGVFVGSEALGRLPDADHLQMFESRRELAFVLHRYFSIVRMREISYPVRKVVRREAYWRCSTAEGRSRLDRCEWEDISL